MPFNQKKFVQAIQEVVSNIRPGQVMSYGEVARAAGFPRHARMVGKAIGHCAKPLPWHRVVKSDRRLAFEAGSEPYIKQEKLLEKEGIYLLNGKVVQLESDETLDLDKLLWGPPES